jgi:hypothetical protein
MTKTQIVIEHVVVTFIEATAAYLIVVPTVSWNKAAIAGAVGAGLSAAYNVLRQSEPSLVSTGSVTVPPVVITPTPEVPAQPTNQEVPNVPTT